MRRDQSGLVRRRRLRIAAAAALTLASAFMAGLLPAVRAIRSSGAWRESFPQRADDGPSRIVRSGLLAPLEVVMECAPCRTNASAFAPRRNHRAGIPLDYRHPPHTRGRPAIRVACDRSLPQPGRRP